MAGQLNATLQGPEQVCSNSSMKGAYTEPRLGSTTSSGFKISWPRLATAMRTDISLIEKL